MSASPRHPPLDTAALRRAIHHGLHDGSSPQLLHRLHALLLAGQCHSLREAAQVGGDSLRSLQRWQRRWCEAGASGLGDAGPHGRKRRLAPALWQRLCERVRTFDRDAADDGRRPMSAALLERLLLVEFGQHYSRRQCRRLLLRMRGVDAAVADAPGDLSALGGETPRGGCDGWLM